MPTLLYVQDALSDLERLQDFVTESDPLHAAGTVGLIRGGLSILCHHPLIGRVVRGNLRELVISRGRSGYVALYTYDDFVDAVTVLAIRHQREAGY